MAFFDTSKIPEGKERKHLLLSIATFAFWGFFFLGDFFDGAIKWRGNADPVPFADAPFLSFFLFVFTAFLVFRLFDMSRQLR